MKIKGKAHQVLAIIKLMAELKPDTKVSELGELDLTEDKCSKRHL